MAAKVRIGTCSWAEKSLLASGEFYPRGVTSADERLRYYATNFDTVEVDSTYYAIPQAHTVELWAERTPPEFTFHIKVYGALTGHGIDPRTLSRPLRELIPLADRYRQSIRITEPALLHAIADAFTASLTPLRDSGKLGLLVFQYPPWFWYKAANLEQILTCQELMGELPLAVEFRHGSWLSEQHCRQVLAFLQQHRICYVTADEPQYGTQATIPFLPAVTTDIAYVRLHGRNGGNWLKKGVESSARYDYLYNGEELNSFARVARELSATARLVYMMFNNCRAGHAMKNALELARLV